MKKELKIVTREAEGLRLEGFEGLEGREVTIKNMLGRMIIQTKPYEEPVVVPYERVTIKNGYVEGEGLAKIAEQTFGKATRQVFIETLGKTVDGKLFLEYYQAPGIKLEVVNG